MFEFEYFANGIQHGLPAGPVALFTDLLTRSTFSVRPEIGQTIEGQLMATREKFRTEVEIENRISA